LGCQIRSFVVEYVGSCGKSVHLDAASCAVTAIARGGCAEGVIVGMVRLLSCSPATQINLSAAVSDASPGKS
jgi:hypothetical protein